MTEKINYEDLPVDELTELYKNKISEELRLLDKKNAKPENQPKDGLESYSNSKKWSNESNDIHINVLKRFEAREKTKFQNYESGKWLFENSDADTGCELDASSWSPADIYSTIVWNTAVCSADLLSIAVPGLSIASGDGLTCQIRKYGQFPAPTALKACECATCASITFSTYSLKLARYNTETMICNLDIWDVGQVLADSLIQSMADSWKAFFDTSIYGKLIGANAGIKADLDNPLSSTPSLSGSCCIDPSLYDLYNKIHEVVDGAKEGVSPTYFDTLIVSPSVLGIFKRMAIPSPLYWMADLQTDGAGNLTKIGGLNVVSYCGANTVTDASSAIVAVIIDSKRAIGACFGMQPSMKKQYIQGCDAWQVDYECYFACEALDLTKIAFIQNP